MRTFLIITALIAMTGALRADTGDQVVVIYNTRVPESKGVAEHYAERRHVPASQIFGFDLTTNEVMQRAEYRDKLEKPLAKQLENKKLWHIGSDIFHGTNGQNKVIWKVQSSKIRYAVLCYGVPVSIAPDSEIKEAVADTMMPQLRKNNAAVDSELALLPRIEQNYPLTGPVKNDFFTLTNAALFQPTNGLLMVTRLDGPSAEIARGLVDKAIEAESNGLCGNAYFDLRNIIDTNSPYRLGDDWILGAGKICQYYGGYQTIMDTNTATFPADFPMSQIAFYCGWYDEHASGPFAQPAVEFMPGAFAYHLHSFSASTIRSTTQRWVGPLLAKGAAATMGCVDEPFISGTPDVSIFAGRWIVMGFTYGEAAYACQETLSWQTTVIGDPLYQPFAKSLQKLVDEQQETHSKWLEWSYERAINIRLLNGNRPSDMAALLQSLPVTKDSPVLSEKLGDLYYAIGKPASAVEAYQNCIKNGPSRLQRVRVRNYLANVLTEQNRTKEAVDDLKALLQEVPDYPGRGNIEKRIQDLSAKLSDKTAGATP